MKPILLTRKSRKEGLLVDAEAIICAIPCDIATTEVMLKGAEKAISVFVSETAEEIYQKVKFLLAK